MGDDIGSGLSSMITICFDFHSTNVVHTIGLGQSSMTTICFDFHSTNVVQLSSRNPYFYWLWHKALLKYIYESPSMNEMIINLCQLTVHKKNTFLAFRKQLLENVELWLHKPFISECTLSYFDIDFWKWERAALVPNLKVWSLISDITLQLNLPCFMLHWMTSAIQLTEWTKSWFDFCLSSKVIDTKCYTHWKWAA